MFIKDEDNIQPKKDLASIIKFKWLIRIFFFVCFFINSIAYLYGPYNYMPILL
jgi:hypothetical protein